MATITPLLDTLLHEVLGRRMDPPSRPQLTPPVTPVYPSKAPQAVQGDSRLQSRGPALEVQDASRAPGQRFTEARPEQSNPPASSYTRLSPAAHLISNVLARFPAPPSVIRPSGPLLPAAPQAPVATPSADSSMPVPGAQVLGERLSASIRDSGLFYESHLKSWFRGSLPMERLLRQPQMQATGQQLSPPASTDTSSARQGVQASESAAREGFEVRSEVGRASPALQLEQSETLQSLLRHQLELLVNPVLRWEGEVWPGLFMSLVLELPRQDVEEPGGEAKPGSDADEQCRAELDLVVEGLGELQASLLLAGEHLSLKVTTPSPPLYALMNSGRPVLEERLQSAGLSSDLQVLLKESDSDQGL